MIRTLIVEDDAMAASIHRQFTERVGGFEVVGEATSGARALQLSADLHPDLMLLDMYLPDMSGLEVLRRVRGSAEPTDVIAITAAKDVEILRTAVHLGVVHYIVKPFTFRAFRERFENYAAARSQLDQMQFPGQREIDRLYGLLRTSTEDSLPKGISGPTLALAARTLKLAEQGMTAAELAGRAGFSQGVARRYLKYLCDTGSVDVAPRYGAAGRPEHLYHWTGASPG